MKAATTKDLRSFGLLVGTVFGLIGIWPLLLRGEPIRFWAIGVSGILILLGLIAPSALVHVHRGWMWLGYVLGAVNTKILLTFVFYGLITPTAFLFRLLGKDPMRLGFREDSTTYRVIRQPRSRGHMKYQF